MIADLAETAPEMFSKFIDAEWHRLMRRDDYSAFCMMSVGHPVGHLEGKGHGTPAWLDLYHERFGTLPPAWFASAEGIMDREAYERYMDSRTLIASRDCGREAGSGEPRGVITAWDCTPTTGDPDFAESTPDGPVPPVPDQATD